MSQLHTWFGAAGDQLGLLLGRVGALPASFAVLAGDGQQPVHGGDRAQVDAVIEQPGPHLGGGQIAELRASATPPGRVGVRLRTRRSAAPAAAPAGPGPAAGAAGSGWRRDRPSSCAAPAGARHLGEVVEVVVDHGFDLGSVSALSEMQLQERVHFSRDLQRRAGAFQLGLERARCAGGASRARPPRRCAAAAGLRRQALQRPGVAGLAPLRRVRRVQALAAQQRAPLRAVVRQRVVLGQDPRLVLGGEGRRFGRAAGSGSSTAQSWARSSKMQWSSSWV